ncbi:restriction endonuclease subunit S [Streptomyces sp. NPDC001880]
MSEKELPAGWAITTLDQVAAWGSGGTPKAGTSAYYGGDIPWTVIGDLMDGPLSETKSTITEAGLANSSAKWVPEGAVLVAMYGSIGKLGVARRRLTTNQAIAFAIPDGRLMDAKFLFWYLRSQRAALLRAGKGGTQQNISQTVLRAWPVLVPPFAEQHRIVEALEGHLSRLDAAEALVGRVAERVVHLHASVTDITLQHAIPGGAEGAPPLPPAGSDDGALPTLPSNWHWERLGDLAEVVGGVTKDQKKQSDPQVPEVPYLRVANVQRGKLDLDHVTHIRVSAKKAEQLKLLPGDVLLNEGGDRNKLGRGWIWDGQIENAIHQNHVFRARIRDGRLHPKLLSWHANRSGKWFEVNGKQSVNLASISLSKIKKFPVPVPPPEVQEQILERIEGQVSLIENAEVLTAQALSRAATLRRAILNRAFTGALVPQDPADEPASALLARIQAERAAQPKAKRARRAPAPRKSKALTTSPPAPAPSPTLAPAHAVQQEFDL